MVNGSAEVIAQIDTLIILTFVLTRFDSANGLIFGRFIYGPPADKRDLTTFCNKLTNTHLKVLKITIFYCHSKRVYSCVMHSSISYL